MADGIGGGGRLAFLSKKVAGIPVSVLLLVGVLVLAVVAWRMRDKATGDAGTDVGVASDSSVGDPATDAADPAGDAYSGFTANPTPTYDPSVGNTTTVDTNSAWVKRGTEWAIANLHVSGGDAQQALQLYVDGEQLSYAQGAIRDAVMKQYGAPPENFTPGGTGAKPTGSNPAAKPQGTPPCVHTVKGTNDNSLTALIHLYYGGANDAPANSAYDLIQAANPSLPQGGPYPVGTKVNIPKFVNPVYFTATKTAVSASAIAAKNGISTYQLGVLNDGVKFPVKVGTKVRVH